MRTLKQALNKDYIDVPGYPRWGTIKKRIIDYLEFYAPRARSEYIVGQVAGVLIDILLYRQGLPVYYVPRSFFEGELHKKMLTDESVRKFAVPISAAFFILPTGVFVDHKGLSIDWLFYKKIDSAEFPIEVQHKDLKIRLRHSSDKRDTGRIFCGSIHSNTFDAFVTSVAQEGFLESLSINSLPLFGEPPEFLSLADDISKTLINILMYMDSEVIKDSPVGFQHKTRSRNERTLLNPNWIKPRVVYVNRTSLGGSHASPIPHERREHLRRIRDAEGNIVKIVKVKASKVNMKEALSIK